MTSMLAVVSSESHEHVSGTIGLDDDRECVMRHDSEIKQDSLFEQRRLTEESDDSKH